MRLFDFGAREGDQAVHDRVLTVPNAITAARLAGLPLFAWLVLGPEALLTALAVLMVIGATDWVDGYVARRFDQVSRIGVLLDPLVDRLLVLTVALTLLSAGILPLWLVVLLLLRDGLVIGGALLLFGRIPPIPVTRTGKTATALLMVGLPLFLLAADLDQGLVRIVALGVTLVGAGAYYGAAAQYSRSALSLRRQDSA